MQHEETQYSQANLMEANTKILSRHLKLCNPITKRGLYHSNHSISKTNLKIKLRDLLVLKISCKVQKFIELISIGHSRFQVTKTRRCKFKRTDQMILLWTLHFLDSSRIKCRAQGLTNSCRRILLANRRSQVHFSLIIASKLVAVTFPVMRIKACIETSKVSLSLFRGVKSL